MSFSPTSYIGGSGASVPLPPSQQAAVADIYVDVEGKSLFDQPPATQTDWLGRYNGDWASAGSAWAGQSNMNLQALGRAVQTVDGLMSVQNVNAWLIQHGYTGATDANSIVRAYNQARGANAIAPAPAPSRSSSGLGSLSLGALGQYQKPLLLLVAGYVAYELFFRGRR